MNKKKILIGCSIAFGIMIALLIAISIIFYYYVVRPADMTRLQMPPDLANPRIIQGLEIFSKSEFFSAPSLGSITDIKVIKNQNADELIGIAGVNGAMFLNVKAQIQSRVMFNHQSPHVDIIDIEGDGIMEYMNRGSWCCDASLIDSKGNNIWTYGGSSGIDDMAAGDIDNDGKLEFVVGFNGGGGVHLLDTNGKKLWEKPDGNVWHVEMMDVDDNGFLEIIHSNAAGEIVTRDRYGDIIQKVKPAPYFSSFSLCKWPTKNNGNYAIIAENDTIWLFDGHGDAAAQYFAPLAGDLGHARGTAIKSKDKSDKYLAAIVGYENWNRSILYIYHGMDKLLYQEILPEVCESIASVYNDESLSEHILLGCKGKVLQYDLNIH